MTFRLVAQCLNQLLHRVPIIFINVKSLWHMTPSILEKMTDFQEELVASCFPSKRPLAYIRLYGWLRDITYLWIKNLKKIWYTRN